MSMQQKQTLEFGYSDVVKTVTKLIAAKFPEGKMRVQDIYSASRVFLQVG